MCRSGVGNWSHTGLFGDSVIMAEKVLDTLVITRSAWDRLLESGPPLRERVRKTSAENVKLRERVRELEARCDSQQERLVIALAELEQT